MSTYIYRVTIDQWEQDEDGPAVGIINVYNEHDKQVATEVFNEGEDIAEAVEYLTGLNVIRLTEAPFNPYGDGRTWAVHVTKPRTARTYDEVSAYVSTQTPFNHPRCSARIIPKRGRYGLTDPNDPDARHLADQITEAAQSGPVYVLTSYRTPVAYVTAEGEPVRTAGHYSATTTRQINVFMGALAD